jgi:hypothetical protein
MANELDGIKRLLRSAPVLDPNIVQEQDWDAMLEAIQAALDDRATASALAAMLALKANLASPTFTGVPSAPTAAPGTNTTQIATMAAVKAAIDGLIAAAPGALDTIDELAAALGDDSNFAASVTNALALKAPLASPALTGNPTAPTVAGTSDNTTKIATTAFVQAVVATLGGPGALVRLETQVASNSPAIDFLSTNLSDAYDRYIVFLDGVKPATDDVALMLRVGTGGGPTWQATGYDAVLTRTRGGSTTASVTNTSTFIGLTEVGGSGAGLGNATGEKFSGRVEFDNPEAADFCEFAVDGQYGLALGNTGRAVGGGRYNTAGAITGLRFQMASGNIASGRFTLCAVRKS